MRALIVAVICAVLVGCGGGGGSGQSSAPAPGTYSATSGVAQKGPLIIGSSVTAQELSASLVPTGKQYSYQTNSDLGTFQPNSTFTSQYIGTSATGYYFDEAVNAISGGTITLNGYSDLSSSSALNVNLLTTLAYQRIQTLVKSGLDFATAATQAENEVLAAFNIRNGAKYGPFSSLDLTKTTDGDRILVALSSLFVFGNTSGNLAALVANVQSDIGANGTITSAGTKATLAAAARALDPDAIAANLTARYSSVGAKFEASDIRAWIDQDGDGIIGNFKFRVVDATQTSVFVCPAFVTDPLAGKTVSATNGQLIVNDTPVSGAIQLRSGDRVAVAPSPGVFPSGALTIYIVADAVKIARVTFIKGLSAIAISPPNVTIQVGATQAFVATATFTDGSSADLTATASWSSSERSAASINLTTGVAKALAVGATTISATSGSVSGSTLLSVIPAALQSVSVTPNPSSTGVGMARQLSAIGSYTDGTTADLTTSATWSTSAPSVATVSGGIVTGVALGSSDVTATVGSLSGTSALSVTAGVWSAAAPLTISPLIVDYHSATLLNNGKVLVAGGDCATIDCGYAVSGSESYDAVADVWTPKAKMKTPRFSHTATLLANGKVLVAGGYTKSMSVQPSLATAELYDPATNTWSPAGTMSVARNQHVAVLLPNGKVLVAGGVRFPEALSNYQSVEIYDPASDSWSVTASTSTSHDRGTATVLQDGRVLIAGGQDSSAEIYDPATATWSPAANMSKVRTNHTATLLSNGKVLVTGGFSTPASTPSAELYDPATNSWTGAASMMNTRGLHTATLLPNGDVLVVGGSDNSGATAEIYHPASDSWTSTPNLTNTHIDHTTTLLPDSSVLVCGGWRVTCERYW